MNGIFALTSKSLGEPHQLGQKDLAMGRLTWV